MDRQKQFTERAPDANAESYALGHSSGKSLMSAAPPPPSNGLDIMSTEPPANAVSAYSTGASPAMLSSQPPKPEIFTPQQPTIFTPQAPQEQPGDSGHPTSNNFYANDSVGGNFGGGLTSGQMAGDTDSWHDSANEFGFGSTQNDSQKPVDQVKAEIMAGVVCSHKFNSVAG